MCLDRSHYQVLFDKEYMGRALSTANFFNFGGVFFVQWLTGKIIFIMGGNSSGAPIGAYRAAFLFVAISYYAPTIPLYDVTIVKLKSSV